MGGLLPPDRPVNRKDFCGTEAKKVYSVAVMPVVAWLLIQVVTQVFPPFEYLIGPSDL